MNALVTITIGAMSAAIFTLAFAVWTKKDWLKDFISGGIVIWFAIYAILFLDSSFYGAEKTLALEVPKEFCELYIYASPEVESLRQAVPENQAAGGVSQVAVSNDEADAKCRQNYFHLESQSSITNQ